MSRISSRSPSTAASGVTTINRSRRGRQVSLFSMISSYASRPDLTSPPARVDRWKAASSAGLPAPFRSAAVSRPSAAGGKLQGDADQSREQDGEDCRDDQRRQE